jgi:uncharacterized protein YcaQ
MHAATTSDLVDEMLLSGAVTVYYSRMPVASRFRKLALQSQGLTRTRPFGSGADGLARAIEHLGYIQIDTISVVERAHHHVLWSRLPDYQPASLDKLIADKTVFEYWFHAAAYLPMKHYRYALPRMQAIKSGKKHWFSNTDKKLMREIYRRIEVEGPLMARDFQDDVKRRGGWWEWKPAKQALEQLFMEGDLMVVGRQGFQKQYDIAERALPPSLDTSTPTLTEFARHLIDNTLRAHGFAHARSFSYLRKGAELRAEIKRCLQEDVVQGQLLEQTLPAGETVFVQPGTLDRQVRTDRKVRLLSPFDNSVIQRERCRSVFDFAYQIECYVPAAKRLHGYFCLPLLYRDRFLGRVDCKADRKRKELRVVSLSLESEQLVSARLHKTSMDEFLTELAAALHRFMAFNQCDSVVVEKTIPRSIKKPLRGHLAGYF